MFKILDSGEIRIIRGDTAEFEINIDLPNGEPYEMKEDDEVIFTVKKKPSDKDQLIQKTGTKIFIQPNDTSELAFGDYVYDVQVNFADGTVDTIIPINKFKILEEVTW